MQSSEPERSDAPDVPGRSRSITLAVHADVKDLVLEFRHDIDDNMTFTVTGPEHATDFLSGTEALGFMSPLSPVTLKGMSGNAAGVPSSAAQFSFAYPLKELAADSERLLLLNPEPWLSFLLLGGFVYFDAEENCIQINALQVNPAAHKQITLVGPFPADPAAVQWMADRDRMREVTLAPLREAGFRFFGWVRPLEAPGGFELFHGPPTAGGSRSSQAGAFVYQMEGSGPIFYRVSKGHRASQLGLSELSFPVSESTLLSDEQMRTAMGLQGAVSSRFRRMREKFVKPGSAPPSSRVLLVGRRSQAVLEPGDAPHILQRDAPLHTAVLNGDAAEVERLLKVERVDPNRLGTPDWQIRMLNRHKSGRIEALVLMVVNTLAEAPKSAMRTGRRNLSRRKRSFRTGEEKGGGQPEMQEGATTALILAVTFKNVRAAKALLEDGRAEINLREESNNGWTALMWACHLGYQELAILLIRRGASALLQDHSSRNAIELAMATDQTELALSLLPEIFFASSPGAALLASISISASAMASIQQTHHRDADRATTLHEINMRSQLISAGLLRSLGTEEHMRFLRSRAGMTTLLRAAQTGCHIILGRPRMQLALHEAWAGRFISLLQDPDTPFWQRAGMAVCSPLIVLFNLWLLPAVATFPPFEVALHHSLATRTAAYLLRDPSFKFLVFFLVRLLCELNRCVNWTAVNGTAVNGTAVRIGPL